ncbi:Hypothetical protein POVN_LOCUS693 [uncultured virus]|nr:Hypothetical protein POVN_LOCUS693 [uncultured virus]
MAEPLVEYKANLDYVRQLYEVLSTDYTQRLQKGATTYAPSELLASMEGFAMVGERFKGVFRSLSPPVVRVASPKARTPPPPRSRVARHGASVISDSVKAARAAFVHSLELEQLVDFILDWNAQQGIERKPLTREELLQQPREELLWLAAYGIEKIGASATLDAAVAAQRERLERAAQAARAVAGITPQVPVRADESSLTLRFDRALATFLEAASQQDVLNMLSQLGRRLQPGVFAPDDIAGLGRLTLAQLRERLSIRLRGAATTDIMRTSLTAMLQNFTPVPVKAPLLPLPVDAVPQSPFGPRSPAVEPPPVRAAVVEVERPGRVGLVRIAGTVPTNEEMRAAVDAFILVASKEELVQAMKRWRMDYERHISHTRSVSDPDYYYYTPMDAKTMRTKTFEFLADMIRYNAALRERPELRRQQVVREVNDAINRFNGVAPLVVELSPLEQVVEAYLKVAKKEDIARKMGRFGLDVEEGKELSYTSLMGSLLNDLKLLFRANLDLVQDPTEFARVLQEATRNRTDDVRLRREMREEEKPPVEEAAAGKDELKRYLDTIVVGGDAVESGRVSDYGGLEGFNYVHGYRVIAKTRGGREITLRRTNTASADRDITLTVREGGRWQPKGEKTHYLKLKDFSFYPAGAAVPDLALQGT